VASKRGGLFWNEHFILKLCLRVLPLSGADLHGPADAPKPPWGRAPNVGSFAMPKPTEDQIRQRTQQIWEGKGKPEGKEDECRLLAEQELSEPDAADPLAQVNKLT
jgi:DUF2934 family protein